MYKYGRGTRPDVPPSRGVPRGSPWNWFAHKAQLSRQNMEEKGRGTSKRCFHCNEEGHIARNCPKKASQRLVCYNCGGPGHVRRDCPELEAPARNGRRRRERDSEENGELQENGTVFASSRHVQHSSPPNGHTASRYPPRFSKLKQAENGYPVVQQWEHGRRRTSPHHSGSRMASSGPPAYKKSGAACEKQPERDDAPVRSIPFIDTHCHLEYVFEQSRHQGSFYSFMEKHDYPDNFGGCISTFCDPTAFSSSFGIWEELLSESNVWGTFGIHPHNAKYYHSGNLEDKVLRCIEHPKCVAFGEIGLDYAEHSPSNPQIQKEVLVQQLGLAVSYGKPIVLHCRDAEDDLLQILSNHVPHDWKMHLHCFTGSSDMAETFMSEFPNLYIGLGGNITFAKSHHIKRVASEVPLERLLLETDAPYHTPSNMPKARQTKYSHPALAFYVSKEIAKLQNVPLSDVLQSARKNTNTLYGI